MIYVIDYGFWNNNLALIVGLYQCFSYTHDQSMGHAKKKEKMDCYLFELRQSLLSEEK